jgi:hypothetical protein
LNFNPNVQGWSGSADPRKRQFGIKSSEAENIKRYS